MAQTKILLRHLQPERERVSDVLQQGLPTLKLGVLAGPALPADLAEGQYSSMVVASAFDEVVVRMRLGAVLQNRMTLSFEYWRQRAGGAEEIVDELQGYLGRE